MGLVASDIVIGGEPMYELLLLLPALIRVVILSPLRALSRCFLSSLCSGVRMLLDGLGGSIFGRL